MSKLSIKSLLQPWISQQEVVDTALFNRWTANIQLLDVSANEYLIRAGDKTRKVYFVTSGLLRLFYNTPDGKERNKAFYGAGQVSGAISAAMTGNAAPFSIQALESSTLLCADYEPLRDLAQREERINRLFIDLLSEAFLRNEQREAMLLTCNAEQRYQWMQLHEPDLLEKLPQFHIASYIGVEAVSLSRLKRKLAQQE